MLYRLLTYSFDEVPGLRGPDFARSRRYLKEFEDWMALALDEDADPAQMEALQAPVRDRRQPPAPPMRPGSDPAIVLIPPVGEVVAAFLAGAGVKAGTTLGETDDYCYNIVRDPVHVHDLNATILHLLGMDHERLTYRYAGRDFRLTDVAGNVVKALVG